MKFMNENFLLKNEISKELFFNYANKMPIFDFHCHLSPKEIYENGKFEDISKAWLGGDHYKWRLMRSMGIDENCISGNANGLEKFKLFARTLEYSIGNPVYHWAHLELQRYFDEYEPLTEKNAELIYTRVNKKLESDDFRVREIIKKSNVKILFTTDDPIDSLEYHEKIKEDKTFDVEVLPAFRPDKIINIEFNTYPEYIKSLSKVTNLEIKDFSDLLKAIENRIDFFASHGCCASDHAFKDIPYSVSTESELNIILDKALKGEIINDDEINKYKTAIIQFLSKEYKKRDWVMELHFGVLRNNNSNMFEKMGPDTGYDTMGDYSVVESLSNLLNSMDMKNELPKTILFSGNPNDNYPIATLMASFQDSSYVSKMQLGTAWWFNDHINGMKAQISALADVGVLGKFIGMLTDSRSFLSYPRHEYFRRIICNIIGTWIEEGLYNNDLEFVGSIIEDICYNNAIKYFGIKK